MNIQRFRPDHAHLGCLHPDPGGGYVAFGDHEAEVARLKGRLAKAEAVAWKLSDAWENGVSAACEEDDPMGDPETFEKFYREAVTEAVTAGAAYVKEFPKQEGGK